MTDQLIFDIGFNSGEDSEFYLNKGFQIVAVEANPVLCEKARVKFAKEIESNRLILLNIGVWDSEKTIPFYVNLENDHWSSFDKSYGCRNGSSFSVINIQCTSILNILHQYGIPRYMKIDVEGADRIILNDLRKCSLRSKFISVEEYGVDAIKDLHQLGYNHFHFSAQRTKELSEPPNPAREGQYFYKTFTGYDSGVFGEEIPGPWYDFPKAVSYFLENIRDANHIYKGPEHEWFDVHARLEI